MDKRSKITGVATVFGAAITSLHSAPELNANIVTLSFTPGSVGTQASLAPITLSTSVSLGSIAVDNWSIYGKNFYASLAGIDQLALVGLSQLVTTGIFSTTRVLNAYTATGPQYIAFRAGSNVGWFSVDLGGPGNAITFVDGQYGNAGESVHVGGTSIPEPASATGLALLAFGAIGLRRRRNG